MISPERKTELADLFWAKSNDPETQEWRGDLTGEERALIDKWDRGYSGSIASLASEILKHQTKGENK